jgi:hypothetical protein
VNKYLTNIELWYQKRIQELDKERILIMENSCPFHHGFIGFEEDENDPRCYENNNDKTSCIKCWNQVMI